MYITFNPLIYKWLSIIGIELSFCTFYVTFMIKKNLQLENED